MPAFPFVKLGILLVKQISKPIANAVKNRAKKTPFFRNYICMPPAQLYHWCDVRTKMYLTNMIRTKDSAPIPKLNEQAAIELGANLLGEFVIIGVASSILLWEYNRQSNNEARKEEAELEFVNTLEARITDLAFANEELDTRLREMQRLIYATPAIMDAANKNPDQIIPVTGSDAVNKAVKDVAVKLKPRPVK